MWRAKLAIGLSLVTAMFFISAALFHGTRVVAQGDITPKTATPRPTPKGNGGNARWVVKSMTFQSNYPKGFEFALDARSSGGKIIEAQVFWQHSTLMGKRERGIIADDGTVRAVWNGGQGGDAVPQWVGVTYWWNLTDASGNTYETARRYDEYADTTRIWHRAESPDVVVFWQDGVPDAVGQEAIQAIAHQHQFYFDNWGKLINFRPHIIITKNYKPLEEWNPGMGVRSPNGMRIEGQTSASWGGTIQVYYPQQGPKGFSWGTVLHELDHLYQAANGTSFGQCWIIEGDATYFELIQDYDYLERVQQMAADGMLPTIQNGGPSCTGDNARDGYDIGYAFFRYLTDVYGKGAHLRFWTLRAHSKTDEEALAIVTGMNFVDMERDFRMWLGMPSPEPPTPLPTIAFTFPPTPTYPPQ